MDHRWGAQNKNHGWVHGIKIIDQILRIRNKRITDLRTDTDKNTGGNTDVCRIISKSGKSK